MSIIDSYKEKLAILKEDREKIRNLSDDLPDKAYIITMIEVSIKDAETRLQRLTSLGNSDMQCNECQKWIKREETHTLVEVDNLYLCTDCQSTINKVLMTHEAETKWGLPSGTIKQDCRRGMLNQYIEKGLIRRAGKYWLIHTLVGKLYYKDRNKDGE